jgi:hypothetical protein
MKPWTSCAEWPEGLVSNGQRPNVTEDGHYTKEQADCVCRLLEREGFGGERRIFPVRTWSEPAGEETT